MRRYLGTSFVVLSAVTALTETRFVDDARRDVQLPSRVNRVFAAGAPMDVAPHPHIGLQTVTWLLDGEIVHDDSLQQEALLRPGGVNVMTSGGAIAHAERTPDENSGRLNGVQLWTALPESRRHDAASFQHLAAVPTIDVAGGIARVFSGTLAIVYGVIRLTLTAFASERTYLTGAAIVAAIAAGAVILSRPIWSRGWFFARRSF